MNKKMISLLLGSLLFVSLQVNAEEATPSNAAPKHTCSHCDKKNKKSCDKECKEKCEHHKGEHGDGKCPMEEEKNK